MSKIYYAITLRFVNVTRYVNEGDYYRVYELIMFITDNNHNKAANAKGWCELAYIGEIYEDDEFKIEIIEDVN